MSPDLPSPDRPQAGEPSRAIGDLNSAAGSLEDDLEGRMALARCRPRPATRRRRG
ncbi:MAG: hypothetical protein U0800_17750 [Isosphaeraceae bacterium]